MGLAKTMRRTMGGGWMTLLREGDGCHPLPPGRYSMRQYFSACTRFNFFLVFPSTVCHYRTKQPRGNSFCKEHQTKKQQDEPIVRTDVRHPSFYRFKSPFGRLSPSNHRVTLHVLWEQRCRGLDSSGDWVHLRKRG